MKNTIEELLQSSYWVIDILPLQVPKDSPGQYFAIEKYFLQDKQFAEVKQKHINLILKLNCYRDISIDEERVIKATSHLHVLKNVSGQKHGAIRLS